jgi:hypothetical protein
MVGCRGNDESSGNQEIEYPMSKQAVSNVSYPVTPGTTALLSVDCQFGFGAGSWEQVPNADAAVENLRQASRADACASQAIGTLSAEQAHAAAVQRMAYLFAAIETTDAFVARVRALQPAAG